MMGGVFELLLIIIHRVGHLMYDGMLVGDQESEVLVTLLNAFKCRQWHNYIFSNSVTVARAPMVCYATLISICPNPQIVFLTLPYDT